MTLTPLAISSGAVSAALASGSARNAAWIDPCRRAGHLVRRVRRHFAVPDPGQRRQLPRRFHRSRPERGGQADVRMARQDTDELLPGIAGGSNDGNVRHGGRGGDL